MSKITSCWFAATFALCILVTIGVVRADPHRDGYRSPRILDVHDIENADVVRARVIHAHDVHANHLRVRHIHEGIKEPKGPKGRRAKI